MRLDITSKEYETMIDEMKRGKENVKTTWGNAKISSCGHYRITSRKEGYNNRFVHRIIWESFYEKKIPDGYDIHHVDNNPLNNSIQNLQCVEHSKHASFHAQGRTGENNPMWGTKRPEHSKRMSGENNPAWKNCARIVKKGFNLAGNQQYALRFDGKTLRVSVNIHKLIDWFSENYPQKTLPVSKLFL